MDGNQVNVTLVIDEEVTLNLADDWTVRQLVHLYNEGVLAYGVDDVNSIHTFCELAPRVYDIFNEEAWHRLRDGQRRPMSRDVEVDLGNRTTEAAEERFARMRKGEGFWSDDAYSKCLEALVNLGVLHVRFTK